MIQINTLSLEALDLLNRTFKTFPQEQPVEYWISLCDAGRAFMFTQVINGVVTYAAVVEICEAGLNARFGSGKDFEWDVQEVHDFLVNTCKVMNKPKLRLTGRTGWWKHLKHFGFEKVDKIEGERLSIIFEKDINLGE